jgi:phosphonate transport system substrate-binding protein
MLLYACFAIIPVCQADEYTLAIQPILSQNELKESYQPLADYLSAATGHTISISTHRNFLLYWTKMRKQEKGFDLVLDAAHFTDYRIKTQGYTVLAKMPDTVSFSIITTEDNFILDVDELIGLRIATMPSPSLGALRLEELFPNPMRLPNYIWAMNTTLAVNSLLSGKVDAAIIPTRLASTYNDINIVMTTDPVPHMGLSASPKVPKKVTEAIRNALLNAGSTSQGQEMLSKLKLTQFEATSEAAYDGYANLLKEVYGFDKKLLKIKKLKPAS